MRITGTELSRHQRNATSAPFSDHPGIATASGLQPDRASLIALANSASGFDRLSLSGNNVIRSKDEAS